MTATQQILPGEPDAVRRVVARVLVGAAVLAAALLGLVAVAPPELPGVRGPRVHVAIEVIASLVAASTAALVAGRALRGGQVRALLLTAALVLAAGVNFAFAVVPGLTDDVGDQGAGWAATLGRLAAAVLFLGAAVSGPRAVARPRRGLLLAVLGAVLVVVALVGARDGLADVLPGGGGAEAWLAQDRRVVLLTPTAVTLAWTTTLLLHLAAVPAFLRRARSEADELLGWFAAASLLLALARLGFIANPDGAVRWVLTADLLRTAAYVALLAGVVREVAALQGRIAGLAVLEERRRLARDLHDGVAQELTSIKRLAHEVQDAGGPTADLGDELLAASDRALEESRAAIAALSRPAGETLLGALRAAAEGGTRGEARVDVHGPTAARAGLLVQEALGRVVREAAFNAVRHGRAEVVAVDVDLHPQRLVVRVRDDGTGFDVDAARGAESFGLISMRERIEALGGTFAVRSSPGTGTLVEVEVPA